MSFNELTIVGNLGRDPEMNYTPSGQACTRMSVATNRKYKSGEGALIEEATWFNVTAWGRHAENCNQYLQRGSRVFIKARLTPDADTGGPRIWNRQDGTPGASYDVTVKEIVFLGRAGEGRKAETGGVIVQDDDIPF